MKTIKLQRPVVDIRPAMPAAIMGAVITLLVVLNLVASWPRPQAEARPTVVPTAALPIIVIATRAPEPSQQLVIERIVHVVVTATPAAEPAAQVEAPAEAPAYQVENAAPAPTATAYVANPAIVHNADGSTVSTFEVPTDAPRLCTGFHDWRDYDAMYASSPVCHRP